MDEILSVISALLSSGVSLAVPFLLAALGEIIMEKAGIVNIALEGIMLVAAFFAVWGAIVLHSPFAGLLCALGAALLISLLFAALTVSAQADQIIVGASMNLLALGLTGVLLRGVFGLTGAAVTAPTLGRLPLPGLQTIPFLGPILFNQPVLVYAALLLVPLTHFGLSRTRPGLELRAAGENPAAVDAAGISLQARRYFAVALGGLFCGLAGAYLSISQANTFVEGMTAGRGFIALAIVIIARWHPAGAMLVSLFFGTVSAMQFHFQAFGLKISYQFFLMLPYIMTLLVAGVWGSRMQAPAALAKTFYRE